MKREGMRCCPGTQKGTAQTIGPSEWPGYFRRMRLANWGNNKMICQVHVQGCVPLSFQFQAVCLLPTTCCERVLPTGKTVPAPLHLLGRESVKGTKLGSPQPHVYIFRAATQVPPFPTPQLDDINVTELTLASKLLPRSQPSRATSSSLKPSSTISKYLRYATQASHTSTNCPKWTMIKLRCPRMWHNIHARSKSAQIHNHHSRFRVPLCCKTIREQSVDRSRPNHSIT